MLINDPAATRERFGRDLMVKIVSMKLAVLIPFYKRDDITKLCFKRLKQQAGRLKFDIVTVGSEGKKSQELAESFGFKYVESENNPLSAKMNKGMEACKDYDAVMILGSDNFVSPSVFRLHKEVDPDKEEFYSFNDCHVYSVHHGKLVTGLTDHYEKSNNPSGVARLFTKAALKLVNYNPWPTERNSGMDYESQQTLIIAGAEHKTLDYEGHFILDVKQSDNITSPEIVNLFTEVDVSEMEVLGKKISADILSLKPGEKKKLKREDPPKNHFDKVGVIILEPFHHFKKNQRVLIPKSTAKDLVEKNKAKYAKDRHKQ